MSQSDLQPVPLILSLDQIDPSHQSSVGPKAFNLSRMLVEGFPVPPGFCLTTHAFPEVLSKKDWESLSAGSKPESQLHSIRGRFIRVAIDPTLQSEIEKHLTKLGPGLVAVRSSATAEDLPYRSS